MFRRQLICRRPLCAVEAHKFLLKEHFQRKNLLPETLNYHKDCSDRHRAELYPLWFVVPGIARSVRSQHASCKPAEETRLKRQ